MQEKGIMAERLSLTSLEGSKVLERMPKRRRAPELLSQKRLTDRSFAIIETISRLGRAYFQQRLSLPRAFALRRIRQPKLLPQVDLAFEPSCVPPFVVALFLYFSYFPQDHEPDSDIPDLLFQSCQCANHDQMVMLVKCF